MVSALPGTDGRAIVCDLSSTNGTFVRGKQVLADFMVPGDELYIAGYRFVLEALTAYSA
jgi:pSer/pThr/pTyr-binding forkhead associated (FHA) protein